MKDFLLVIWMIILVSLRTFFDNMHANTMPGGGWGWDTQQMFIRGGSVPGSKPLPFNIPFFTEKVPLSYAFY